MRVKLVLGSLIAFLIPAVVVGAILGALFGREAQLFDPDEPETVEERNEPRTPSETLMRLFTPGEGTSRGYWIAFAIGFVGTEALGAAWMLRRSNRRGFDTDKAETVVSDELLRRTREEEDDA